MDQTHYSTLKLRHKAARTLSPQDSLIAAGENETSEATPKPRPVTCGCIYDAIMQHNQTYGHVSRLTQSTLLIKSICKKKLQW
jgi:hypothetical protein